MLSFLRKARRPLPEKKPSQEIPRRAVGIECLLDKEALSVFREYREVLLREPSAYIVKAAWGAGINGEIDETQKTLHRRLAPVFEEALDLFSRDGLKTGQVRTLDYLVRGLFISKITFMIEFLRNRVPPDSVRQPDSQPLARMTPTGHA